MSVIGIKTHQFSPIRLRACFPSNLNEKNKLPTIAMGIMIESRSRVNDNEGGVDEN